MTFVSIVTICDYNLLVDHEQVIRGFINDCYLQTPSFYYFNQFSSLSKCVNSHIYYLNTFRLLMSVLIDGVGLSNRLKIKHNFSDRETSEVTSSDTK